MTNGGRLPAAFGGPGWSPRTTSLAEELGGVWTSCGVNSEWLLLKKVLLHRPGPEIGVEDPNSLQMLAPVDAEVAGKQHDQLAEAYRREGVTVELIAPAGRPPPNLVFAADLFFMTPEGAIVGRPASTVRAGEERLVARRLAELGVPILHTVRGTGTFEGADVLWLRPDLVVVATGLRTNAEGARQVADLLGELGVRSVSVELPEGAMHLMGTLRLLDRDLAVFRPGGAPARALEVLQDLHIEARPAPPGAEITVGQALNVVPLGPRRVVMPAGNPATRSFLVDLGVECIEVEIGEIAKAAGGIACMTGVLERELLR